MFASAVETSVEKADPLFQVVPVQSHHSVSHHLLLPNETLQLITLETLQPAGGHDEIPRVGFKISCRHKVRRSFSAHCVRVCLCVCEK